MQSPSPVSSERRSPRAFDEEVVRAFPLSPSIQASSFDAERARRQIQTEGYAIVQDLIDKSALAKIRQFWLHKYAEGRPNQRVLWSPYLGQKNVLGFSDDRFQRLYRSCDFLWNAPFEPLSREICVQLNRMRNIIVGMPVLAGEVFTEDRYGIFVTTSYYPSGGGWMRVHTDGVSSTRPLVHHIVPLTFKGKDYREGGMVIIDRNKRRVDVDAQLQPGDAIFYDGALEHGVDPIVSYQGGVGRLQMFAIPTLFTNMEEKELMVSDVTFRAFARSRFSRIKRRLRDLLRLEPSRT